MYLEKSLLRRLLALVPKLRTGGAILYRFPPLRRLFLAAWKNARKWGRRRPFTPGVNLIGYFRTARGIAEAARGNALALGKAAIPHSMIDFHYGIPSVQQIAPAPDGVFRYDVNLIHVNPPELPYLWFELGTRNLSAAYNIGVWYWELPEFPDGWRFAFDLVDEVWAASEFIRKGMAALSPVPVVRMPPCVAPVYNPHRRRADFYLPDDRFLFLCAYDMLSVQERKNPLGVLEAFRRTFPRGDEPVGLIIKINNGAARPSQVEELRSVVNERADCHILETVFDRADFNALLHLTDAYVSLHRSEGFGLIPAEAMALGKPAILTRWSGNLDFMTPQNSCGVDYRLIPVEEGNGPYSSTQRWADPDLDHAAFFMRKLYSDAEFYAGIANHAQAFIRDHFSPPIVGAMIKARLRELGFAL